MTALEEGQNQPLKESSMHAFSNVWSLVYLCLEGCLLGGQRETKESTGVSYDVVLIAFH